MERAIDVLLLFGVGGKRELGVTEISAELSLSKAAVHRILTSLRSRDLISLDPESRRYRLGPAALGLGRAYLDRIDVRSMAAGELSWLSQQSGETATLSIRTGDIRMYVDQVVPDREVRMEVAVGHPYPLHAGASSKAFLAYLEPEDIDAYIARSGLAAMTDKTVTDERSLRKELAEISARATRSRSASGRRGRPRLLPRSSTTRASPWPWCRSPGPPSGSAPRPSGPSRCCSRPPGGSRPDGAHDFLTRARLNARWASHPTGAAERAERAAFPTWAAVPGVPYRCRSTWSGSRIPGAPPAPAARSVSADVRSGDRPCVPYDPVVRVPFTPECLSAPHAALERVHPLFSKFGDHPMEVPSCS